MSGWSSGMKLEFYLSSPGSTPTWVKKYQKPPSVPLMTMSCKTHLKNVFLFFPDIGIPFTQVSYLMSGVMIILSALPIAMPFLIVYGIKEPVVPIKG